MSGIVIVNLLKLLVIALLSIRGSRKWRNWGRVIDDADLTDRYLLASFLEERFVIYKFLGLRKKYWEIVLLREVAAVIVAF